MGDKMKVITKKKAISSLRSKVSVAGQNTNTGWGCGCMALLN